MKVSIVTISFNQAKYIEETILSILDQDYPDIEYIVVDAGSTDGSRDIINKHRDRIGKIILGPDEGPPDGLNKGFKQASGEIFGFVNADDKLLPGAVSRIVETFKSQPSADVVYGHGYIIDGDNRILRRLYSDPYDLRRFTYGCVTFIQPSVFFRREAFQAVHGFNVINKTSWDGELMADFGTHGMKFILINEFLSAFRVHPLSFGSTEKGSPYRIALEKDFDRVFRKGVQRERTWFDPFIKGLCRLQKWRHNPKGVTYNIGRLLGVVKEKGTC